MTDLKQRFTNLIINESQVLKPIAANLTKFNPTDAIEALEALPQSESKTTLIAIVNAYKKIEEIAGITELTGNHESDEGVTLNFYDWIKDRNGNYKPSLILEIEKENLSPTKLDDEHQNASHSYRNVDSPLYEHLTKGIDLTIQMP